MSSSVKFIFWLLLCFRFADAIYFCDKTYQCGDEIHTACKLQPCGPSSACGENFVEMLMDTESRKLMLELHNKLRNSIALGEDVRGGNGEAANMNMLAYDPELEFVAQCWANYCLKDGILEAHDKCRKTSKYDYVGQNMYWRKTSDTNVSFAESVYIEEAVTSWYEEIENSDPSIIDSFHSSYRGVVGHFTQLIWANTTAVGCGRTQFGNSNEYEFVIYCNYGAGGNLLHEPVYIRGEKCSQCVNGCNEEYVGLCDQEEDNSTTDTTTLLLDYTTTIVTYEVEEEEEPQKTLLNSAPLLLSSIFLKAIEVVVVVYIFI